MGEAQAAGAVQMFEQHAARVKPAFSSWRDAYQVGTRDDVEEVLADLHANRRDSAAAL